MRIRARHYATGDHLDLTCEEGVIQSVGPSSPCVADLKADWMAPAFFDLEIEESRRHPVCFQIGDARGRWPHRLDHALLACQVEVIAGRIVACPNAHEGRSLDLQN